MESRVEGGVRVGYISENGWELAAFGRNITDEEDGVAALDFLDHESTTFTGQASEPRTYGIEAKYRF